MGIRKGGLRLQSSIISVPKETAGCAVMVSGLSTEPSIVGCQLRGGRYTVEWSGGALGRLEGCQIGGGRRAVVLLWDPSTSPLVASNTFRDRGIHILDNADAEWEQGVGNT